MVMKMKCLLAASIFGGAVLVQAAPKLPVAKVSKPNILLIMADDHAKNAISCYGNKDIQTPGLDRLAREGMRFEHALTPNSFCTPSRAAVLTGKYSHKNGVTHLNQKFDGSQQTFPKLLQKAGYETALFGKWHLLSQPTGFDFYCVQKMQGYSLKPILEGKADKVRDASYYHFYDHGKRLPEMVGIRTGRYKLIHYPGMEGSYQWELFDLKEDPDEMENLYRDPKHKEIM